MSGSEVTKGRVYFEETLSKDENTEDLAIAIGLVLLVVGVLPATVIGVLRAMQDPVWGLAVILVWGIAIAVWKSLQRKKETTIDVRVKSDGVFVDQIPKPRLGSGGEFISFDDISGVEYCLGDTSPYIHVTKEDRYEAAETLSRENSPSRFLVANNSSENALETGSYLGGIRIERTNGPAVYIGSDRPKELASIIVEHSPSVEEAEELFK